MLKVRSWLSFFFGKEALPSAYQLLPGTGFSLVMALFCLASWPWGGTGSLLLARALQGEGRAAARAGLAAELGGGLSGAALLSSSAGSANRTLPFGDSFMLLLHLPDLSVKFSTGCFASAFSLLVLCLGSERAALAK